MVQDSSISNPILAQRICARVDQIGRTWIRSYSPFWLKKGFGLYYLLYTLQICPRTWMHYQDICTLPPPSSPSLDVTALKPSSGQAFLWSLSASLPVPVLPPMSSFSASSTISSVLTTSAVFRLLNHCRTIKAMTRRTRMAPKINLQAYLWNTIKDYRVDITKGLQLYSSCGIVLVLSQSFKMFKYWASW